MVIIRFIVCSLSGMFLIYDQNFYKNLLEQPFYLHG